MKKHLFVVVVKTPIVSALVSAFIGFVLIYFLR